MVTNKTVKASLFTLILAFIVIGTVAIAGVMKKEKPVGVIEKTPKKSLDYETWHYNGSSSDSPTEASNYSKTPVFDCGGKTETICEINAPAQDDNPNLPDLTAQAEVSDPNPPTVEDQIVSAMGSGTNKQTNESVLSFREHQ